MKRPVLTPQEQLRLERGVNHLHGLGARATAEFLAEVGMGADAVPDILRLLQEYQDRLTPAMIHAAGAHRFPPPPLREVAR